MRGEFPKPGHRDVTPAKAGVWHFMARLPVFAGVTIICLGLLCSPARALNYEDYPVVKLRSLDKITARTMTFEAKVGSTVRFGEIFIKVQACRKPPPVEKSESAAFLQVWQSDEAKNTSKWIFSGWMFASSPALSAMDHPVYDVWVLDCLGRDPEPIPPSAKGVDAPPTDGEAPDAVPPAADPADQQVQEDVAPEDDPGAADTDDAAPVAPSTQAQPHADDSQIPEESVPASNMPDDVTQTPDQGYAPSHDTPDTYRDETPADDSSPQDDTAPVQQQPAETLEPQPGQQQSPQQFEGIY